MPSGAAVLSSRVL
jgi:hypothetical protein